MTGRFSIPPVFRIHLAACCLLACLLAAPVPASAMSFTVLTNNVPPFKFLKDGTPSGIAGDLLSHLFKLTGHTVMNSQVMSMAQFLEQGYKRPGTVYLALSQSHQKKHHFKWVGPILTAKSGIVVKKSRHLRLARINDARKLTMASVIGSAPEKALMGTAFEEKRFLRFPTPTGAIRALAQGKADGLLLATDAAYHLMARMGIDTDEYETALTLDSIPLYFAFHSSTPDSVINQLQDTLDNIKQTDQNGMSPYLKIISAYY